jgi:hypothetical protein
MVLTVVLARMVFQHRGDAVVLVLLCNGWGVKAPAGETTAARRIRANVAVVFIMVNLHTRTQCQERDVVGDVCS